MTLEAALAAVRAEIPDFDARAAAEEVKAVVKLGERGGQEGNQNARKGEKNEGDNVTFDRAGRGNSKTYLVARLKRDAGTDPKAQGLLRRVEKGELSARQAGLAMGYVRPVDAARIVDQHLKQMAPDELVALYLSLGRNLRERLASGQGEDGEALRLALGGEAARMLAAME